MGKNTEIKLVGQPIMGQILKLIDKADFASLVKSKKADHYYKAFKSWDHLVTLLFGTLSRCDSMGEICEGMRGLSGKLQQLGLKKHPPRVRQAMACAIEIRFFLRRCTISWLTDIRAFCRTAEIWG